MAEPSSETVVTTIPKGRGEEIRIGLQEWRGQQLASIRIWFTAEDGAMRPGKGVTVKVDHLAEIADGVAELLALARERGLVSK